MIPYTLMFLSHSLGDYYFQPRALAKLKSKSTWYVLIHAAIYAAVMLLSVTLYPSEAYLNSVLFAVGSHAAIDIIKQLILNNAAKQSTLTIKQDRLAYLVDQALHMSIIIGCAFWAEDQALMDASLPVMTMFIPDYIGMNGYSILSIAAALLAVMKPTNVFIQKVLITEKPSNDTTTRLRYGGRIGSLERIIIIAMLYLEQYAAIALVFTAKSIVRFKDFENRDFAEYYLYGTLLSVVTSIAIVGLLKLFGV